MLSVVALVPAHNEQESIAATVRALVNQERRPDDIVVIPNGCTDRTAEVVWQLAEEHDITVMEFPERLAHRKSEALNRAWNAYARDADVVICLDADTILPPEAVGRWESEFIEHPSNPIKRRADLKGLRLGGSSSKFTMRGTDFWTRLQRSEFAMWTDTGLRRGYTTVLAGTGCAMSGNALRTVTMATERPGPWSYESIVEDFELTYQMRKLGFTCWISPRVRAYTDSMRTLKSLWAQRMKWQVGTVEDLWSMGWSQLTRLDWYQQFAGITLALVRIFWAVIVFAQLIFGVFAFSVLWLLVVPGLFAFGQLLMATRIPHADRMDYVYAATVVPSEVFAWVRAGWFLKAWQEVIFHKLFRSGRKDRWQLQYTAEAGRQGLPPISVSLTKGRTAPCMEQQVSAPAQPRPASPLEPSPPAARSWPSSRG